MPFRARLTNPVPKGLVKTQGVVGPYDPDAPGALPIAGTYTLTDADLSTIKGIGGILQSEGRYDGQLTEIAVDGTASAPDFSLEIGGRPVTLDTSFDVVVNGTNGSTRLERVEATTLSTPIAARGEIVNLPGPGQLDMTIESEITDGRIEDILALALDAEEPPLTGDLASAGTLHLPPGDTPVRERLQLSGRFGLGDTEFAGDRVRGGIAELSRRGRGQAGSDAGQRVLTDLRGQFTLEARVFTLADLTFRVPGAEVALDGTYNLVSEALSLRGDLRMDATMSEAVGGAVARFIRPIDFVFRRDGAGMVMPLTISGTWRQPKPNVDFWRIIR